MPRACAFLTMEIAKDFFVYDHLTFDPLHKLGWEVVEIPWSQPSRLGAEFDAVVIRSPWDYCSAPQRFIATLSSIEQAGTRLFNPLRVCQWNLDKGLCNYLQKIPTGSLAIYSNAASNGIVIGPRSPICSHLPR